LRDKLTGLQRAIMRVLWARSEASVLDVQEALREDDRWTASGIISKRQSHSSRETHELVGDLHSHRLR
jgi:hypothetical protein